MGLGDCESSAGVGPSSGGDRLHSISEGAPRVGPRSQEPKPAARQARSECRRVASWGDERCGTAIALTLLLTLLIPRREVGV